MSNTILLDGKYTNGIYVGRPRIQYPFGGTGDTQSIIVSREFRCFEESYVRGQMGVMKDPRYADAYLVGESDPVPTGIGSIVSVTRTFARIPTTQTVPTSVSFTKPNVANYGTSKGTVRDYSGQSLSGTGYIYGSALFVGNQIYSLQTLDSTTAVSAPTGGTFTITYKNSTTAAINYNETAANIATAVNALADCVTDGITWGNPTILFTTAPRYALHIPASVGTPLAWLSCNASSLTGVACNVALNTQTRIPSFGAITHQFMPLAIKCVKLTHGISASGYIAQENTSLTKCYVHDYGVTWSVIDANTIAVCVDTGLDAVPTHLGKYLRAYTAGTDRVYGQMVSTFYLPGISSGIATAADVPIPVNVASNDTAFLTLAAGSATGFQTYDSKPLEYWLGTILRLDTLQISMADL